jgi:restriction endonuclease S subunit
MDWPMVPFEEALVDVSRGNPKVPKSRFSISGSIPVVDQGQSAIAGYVDDSASKFTGDLPVIVFGDHTRRFKFVDFPFAIGAEGVRVLSARSDFDSRFVFHYLQSVDIPSAGYSRHFKFLKTLQVPQPPLDSQRHIALALDKADALCVRRQRTSAILGRINAAVFHELFGDSVTNSRNWPEDAPLGELADVASGITKGRKTRSTNLQEVPYLAVSNVQADRLDMRVVKSISVSLEEIARFRLQRDDLLLTEGGDPDKLGRGTLWKEELPLCLHQNHVFRIRIRDREKLLPEFLSALISSARGRRYFFRAAKQTTGIASINKTQLRAFPLLLPPMDAQRKFAERVASIVALEGTYAQHSAELDSLFASLQSRAFNGEL